MTELAQFQDMLLWCETITTIPMRIVKHLHKQGVYVRPNSTIRNKILTAFVMAEGKEREIQVQLVSELPYGI